MTAIRIEHVLDVTGLLQAIVGLARSRENEAQRVLAFADVVVAWNKAQRQSQRSVQAPRLKKIAFLRRAIERHVAAIQYQVGTAAGDLIDHLEEICREIGLGVRIKDLVAATVTIKAKGTGTMRRLEVEYPIFLIDDEALMSLRQSSLIERFATRSPGTTTLGKSMSSAETTPV